MSTVDTDDLELDSDPDLEDVIEDAITEARARIPGFRPAIVRAFDSTRGTVDAEPVVGQWIDGQLQAPKVLRDIPCAWIHGGGSTITWYYQAGDTVGLIPADRDISGWVSSGSRTPQTDRDHSQSDWVAYPGPAKYGELASSLFTASDGLGVTTPTLQVASADIRLGSFASSDPVALSSKVDIALGILLLAHNALAVFVEAHVHPGKPATQPEDVTGKPNGTCPAEVSPLDPTGATKVKAE